MLILHEKTDNYEKAFFDSSDISYIKYNKDTKQMLVLFKKGHRIYLYSNVARHHFITLMNAESLGKAFKLMMRSGRDKELYEVQKIGALEKEESEHINKILKEHGNENI